MRDNIGTIIGLIFGTIFFVALANEFVIFYSEIKYEEVTWSYFLIISTLFGISMLFCWAISCYSFIHNIYDIICTK